MDMLVAATPANRILEWSVITARTVLGLILIAAVLIRIFAPNSLPLLLPPAKAFNDVMASSYLTSLVFFAEFAIGLALISGRFVPLALLAFAPIHLNIILFHVFLDAQPNRIVQTVVLLAIHLGLVWYHREAFTPILRARSVVKLTWLQRAPVLLLGLGMALPGTAKLLVPFEALAQNYTGAALMTGMYDTGYLFQLIAISELLTGLALLSSFFVPLALTIIAPIAVNIFAYHAYYEPGPKMFPGVLIAMLTLSAAWLYRPHFAALWRAR